MKRILSWLLKPAPVTITIIATCVALIAIGRYNGLDKSEWASWIQAFGSIAAILGSFALARYQAKQAEEVRKQEALWRAYGLAHAAADLASDVEYSLIDVCRKMRDRRAVGRLIGDERLLQVQRSLDTFSQKDLSPLTLSQILILQREVAYSLTAMRQLGKRVASETRIQNATERLKRVSECRSRINDQANYYARMLDHED